jgi:hypothetical protein
MLLNPLSIRGTPHIVPVDMIYNVPGAQTSLTTIINQLGGDEKNGTLNPNLWA